MVVLVVVDDAIVKAKQNLAEYLKNYVVALLSFSQRQSFVPVLLIEVEMLQVVAVIVIVVVIVLVEELKVVEMDQE
jgi:hypothetical protein